MLAVNPVASNSRPLFGALPLKSGSASFFIPMLSKQSFVSSSQRLPTDYGLSKIALKAGKEPKDTPVQEEDEEEKEVPDILRA